MYPQYDLHMNNSSVEDEVHFLINRPSYFVLRNGSFWSRGYTCLLILYGIFSVFQRPIGIVALSLNNM
jgi:hypothetical protein